MLASSHFRMHGCDVLISKLLDRVRHQFALTAALERLIYCAMYFMPKTNRALIFAIILSFIVMIGIGLPLLNTALKGKEKDFNDKLFFVVGSFEEHLLKDSTLIKTISDDSTFISFLTYKFKVKTDSVFRENGIPVNYVLGAGKITSKLLNMAEIENIQRNWNTYKLFWSSDSQYNNSLVETRVKVAFLGQSINKIYFVKIFLPFKRQFLLRSLIPVILTMALTLIILFICFLVLLSVIKKQKQLVLSKNDVISNMTHELKTPLFTMSLAAKMLEQAGTLTIEKQHVYLATIREEIARLLTLADRVLETFNLDEVNSEELKEQVDIHQLLKFALSRLQLLQLERRAIIEINFGATQQFITGNRLNLENVFVNIIDNAIKYSGPDASITIRTKNERKTIVISIADNGIGFDPSLKELVFEKFFRAHTGNIHNIKGYGIGLNFAKEVIDAHGGHVSAESAIGKGSNFFITLPTINLENEHSDFVGGG